MTDDGGLVGWRGWTVTPDGRLVSPIESMLGRRPESATVLPDSGTMVAHCPLAHPSPVSLCCGVSATGFPDRMAAWLATWDVRYTDELRLLGTLAGRQRWLDTIAVTEGTGHEPILAEHLLDHEFYKAGRWTLERVHLPRPLPRPLRRYTDALTARYGAPVVVGDRSGLDFVRDLLGEPDLSECATCGAEIVGRTDYVGFCDWCTAPPAR